MRLEEDEAHVSVVEVTRLEEDEKRIGMTESLASGRGKRTSVRRQGIAGEESSGLEYESRALTRREDEPDVVSIEKRARDRRKRWLSWWGKKTSAGCRGNLGWGEKIGRSGEGVWVGPFFDDMYSC